MFTAQLILSQPKLFAYKLVREKSNATDFLNARKQPLRKHEDVCVLYARQPTYNPQMTEGTPYNKGVRKDQHTGGYGGCTPSEVKSDGKRYSTDVIFFKTAESEPERTVWHPTQKPVDLGRYLVRTFTDPGDLVLDNCFGSGSFLLAAHLEGRDYLGIELNQNAEQFRKTPVDYVGIAEQRLGAHGATPTVVRHVDRPGV